MSRSKWKVVAFLLSLCVSSAAAAQIDLLESLCNECSADLTVARPAHANDCPSNEDALNAQLAAIDAQIEAARDAQSAKQISHDEYSRRFDELYRQYKHTLDARSNAQARARQARLAAEQRQREYRNRIEEAQKEARERAEEAEWQRIRDEQELENQRYDQWHQAETERLDREYQETYERTMRPNDWNSSSEMDSSPLYDEMPRDYESEPLRIGDPHDTGEYIRSMQEQLATDAVGMPDPYGVAEGLVYEEAPQIIGLPGSIFASLESLAVTRDSVIDNVIERIPGEMERMLGQLDEQAETDAILDSLSYDPGSPTGMNDSVSPSRIRRIFDDEVGGEVEPSVPNQDSGSGFLGRIRELWAEHSKPAVEHQPTQQPKPREYRNLLNP